MGTATRALAWEQTGEVAGAIAQQRHGLTIDSGQHQLAQFAIGHGFQRHWVDNLNDEIILPDVKSVLFRTLEGHTWSHHLGDTIRVVGLHAQLLLDALALFFAVGLGSNAQHA